MKVCVSVPPHTCIVYRIRGRTDTMVGVGAVYCHLSLPSTPSFSFFPYILPTLIFPSSPSLSLILPPSLSVSEAISFSFVLLPPLSPYSPPHLPSVWPAAFFPPRLDHVGHGRPLNIHHSGTSRKTKKSPPCWTASIITARDAKAGSHAHSGRGRRGKENGGGTQGEVGCGPVRLH